MSLAHFHVTPRSANAKTGPIVVTTSSANTCPDACPLKRTCYAKAGPLALHWSAVTRGDRGDPWRTFLATLADALRKAPRGQVWRHNQAGDLPGVGDAIDDARLAELADVNRAAGAKGFTYTHKPVTPADARGDVALAGANLASIFKAKEGGLVINLSANNLAHADALADASGGRLPVCVVLPEDAPPTLSTPGGRKVVVCPAQQREGVTCATCRLCSRGDRSVVVGFLAHGSGKKHIKKEGGAS